MQKIFILLYCKKENMKATAKRVILTAIYFKGIEQVKKEVNELAEKSLCSVFYVKSIIRKVETNQIEIKINE